MIKKVNKPPQLAQLLIKLFCRNEVVDFRLSEFEEIFYHIFREFLETELNNKPGMIAGTMYE